MQFTEEEKQELQLFVNKWKNSISDSDTYFSFNGHGHLRYVNANEAYTNIAGEGVEEDWIKQEDEDLSIHYIQKVNGSIDVFIEGRNENKEAAVRSGKVIGPLLIAILFAVSAFFIYLFVFWLNH